MTTAAQPTFFSRLIHLLLPTAKEPVEVVRQAVKAGQIALGVNDNNQAVVLRDQEFADSLALIGSYGYGQKNQAMSICAQLIASGQSVIFFDDVFDYNSFHGLNTLSRLNGRVGDFRFVPPLDDDDPKLLALQDNPAAVAPFKLLDLKQQQDFGCDQPVVYVASPILGHKQDALAFDKEAMDTLDCMVRARIGDGQRQILPLNIVLVSPKWLPDGFIERTRQAHARVIVIGSARSSAAFIETALQVRNWMVYCGGLSAQDDDKLMTSLMRRADPKGPMVSSTAELSRHIMGISENQFLFSQPGRKLEVGTGFPWRSIVEPGIDAA